MTDATLTDGDQFRVRFDNNRNGTFDALEDQLAVLGTGEFFDSFGDPSFGWGFEDSHPDGAGAVGRAGGMNFFEMVHPLNSGDPEDFALAHGAVVGYCVRYFQDHSASDATTYPVGCASASADLSGYAELIARQGEGSG